MIDKLSNYVNDSLFSIHLCFDLFFFVSLFNIVISFLSLLLLILNLLQKCNIVLCNNYGSNTEEMEISLRSTLNAIYNL